MIAPTSPDGRELEEMSHDEIVALYRANWSTFGTSEEEAADYGAFVADVVHGIHDGPVD